MTWLEISALAFATVCVVIFVLLITNALGDGW